MTICQLNSCNIFRRNYVHFHKTFVRFASAGCTKFQEKALTTEIKHRIEKHWRNTLTTVKFDENKADKHYVLSMFPYPSGNLHMGHVRVYTISDAMAWFYRLNGKNVLHPIGWDAFGLPAENAAIERKIPAAKWTRENIGQMKKQLELLGCTFDWSREISTCEPDYYKWTQWLFLQMFREGLAYQSEADVNWDPVDKTVLAHEQVDANGYSWRSGAKVEKKLLKQWFIKTTKYSKQLFDGLDHLEVEDWRDVIKMQKHWIGECDGYSFDLDLFYVNEHGDETKLRNITVWTKNPEELKNAGFIALKTDHILNKTKQSDKLLDIAVKNPFSEGTLIPLVVCDDVDYPAECNAYLGVPSINEKDREIAERFWLQYDTKPPSAKNRDAILKKARHLNIGGFLVNSKTQNWLISRQRYWGTPIPIVHCQSCGAVPVRDSDLPVVLPQNTFDENGKTLTLKEMSEWRTVECPKCGDKNAQRETDTMDTFMDSSWYYLRYLDARNSDAIFSKKLAHKLAPVDLYIGGKEHAVLHLYYARFVSHFLHGLGLVPQKEPFKRLIPQGMVLGQTYQVKKSGKYLQPDEVTIAVDKEKLGKETATGKPVVIKWDKMSKSKGNGVDPVDLISEYSCDTIRLIMLADVAPKTPRNWSKDTFPGILKWQDKIWQILNEFHNIRSDEKIGPINDETQDEFKKFDTELFDRKNYHIRMATVNLRYLHNLNTAFKGPQGLTTSLRKIPKHVIKYSPQYEEALAAIIVMTAPFAPHFALELWSKFATIPNRVNQTEDVIRWTKDVLEQKWPQLDAKYEVTFRILANGCPISEKKYPSSEIDQFTEKAALSEAMNLDAIKKYRGGVPPSKYVYHHYEKMGVFLHLIFEDKKKENEQDVPNEKSQDAVDL